MSLKRLIEEIIIEYPKVTQESFQGHSFASYFRNSIPKSIASCVDLPDIYSMKASAGNGAWAKVPWIAIFNKFVTETVTSGFYCVYLFRVDCSGVYLSLNQGFADKRDRYGIGVARDMIKNQAKLFRDFLGESRIKNFSDPLDLRLEYIPKETTTRRLGLAYEAGNIISKFYSKDNFVNVNDETLKNDLMHILEIYLVLF